MNKETWQSRFGTHCSCCGSLVQVCTDQVKCREEASCHIEDAIRKGTSDHPLLATAHELFGETVLSLRDRS